MSRRLTENNPDWKEYIRLRDEGMKPKEAIFRLGYERTTGLRWERSYRNLRGLPPPSGYRYGYRIVPEDHL